MVRPRSRSKPLPVEKTVHGKDSLGRSTSKIVKHARHQVKGKASGSGPSRAPIPGTVIALFYN